MAFAAQRFLNVPNRIAWALFTLAARFLDAILFCVPAYTPS